MLFGMHVEHEVRESALQLRAHVPIHGEAAAGDLHRTLEIQNPQLLAQFPVRLRSETELARRSPAPYFLVVGF